MVRISPYSTHVIHIKEEDLCEMLMMIADNALHQGADYFNSRDQHSTRETKALCEAIVDTAIQNTIGNIYIGESYDEF